MILKRGTLLLATALMTFTPGAGAGADTGDAPAPAAAPVQEQRPNVLVWMLDDVGFAQLSCFGGLVDTPNIDRVAMRGLRYSNYHTTPVCSSSRAAFLTGRNPHSVHMGAHAASPRPFPGYDAMLPADAGTIAANMRASGYDTFALGKWDHIPGDEMTPAGPYDHWPTRQGFDRFYGFLAADTNNFDPMLVRGTTPVVRPRTPGYHLNDDLANQAITMIRDRHAAAAPAPFFMYFATGTAHAPHHAPAEWIARYKGKFDMGWDKARDAALKREVSQGLIRAGGTLAPRPEGMPPWDSLTKDEKRLYARQMEAFAGALSYADAEFGRVLDELERLGELDNTIVIITSDNGASAEGALHGTYNESLFMNGKWPDVADNLRFIDKWGSAATYPHYAFGWAVAGNTPFRYYKTTAYEGGTHVPMILSWPRKIAARGEIRDQFVNVTDLAPTIMQLAGVPLAKTVNNVPQSAMEGYSFSYSIGDAKARGNRPGQYYELYGNRSFWLDNWSIVVPHRTKSWDMAPIPRLDEPWELYNLNNDPGQAHNLASRYPEKVRELDAQFQEQAKRYKLLPLGDLGESRQWLAAEVDRKFKLRDGRWAYPGPIAHIAEPAAPPTSQRPFRMTTTLDLHSGRETGPIYAHGGMLGGMGFYLKQGVPTMVLREMDGTAQTVSANRPLAPGKTTLELEIDHARGKPLTPTPTLVVIKANGVELARQTLTYAMPASMGLDATFDIGMDYGSPVSPDYPAEQPFPGHIGPTVFDFNLP